MRARFLVLVVGLSGCINLGPTGRAAEPRYFEPQLPSAVPSVEAAARAPMLRLRRVSAASHLKERIVWRRSDVEFGFYDLRRWTQPPARFAESALARELFENGGLRRFGASSEATLEVEVRAFEEVLEPEHEALVELAVLLVDRRKLARIDRTFRARRAIAGRDPVEVARAMGTALEAVSSEVALAVRAALEN